MSDNEGNLIEFIETELPRAVELAVAETLARA